MWSTQPSLLAVALLAWIAPVISTNPQADYLFKSCFSTARAEVSSLCSCYLGHPSTTITKTAHGSVSTKVITVTVDHTDTRTTTVISSDKIVVTHTFVDTDTSTSIETSTLPLSTTTTTSTATASTLITTCSTTTTDTFTSVSTTSTTIIPVEPVKHRRAPAAAEEQRHRQARWNREDAIESIFERLEYLDKPYLSSACSHLVKPTTWTRTVYKSPHPVVSTVKKTVIKTVPAEKTVHSTRSYTKTYSTTEVVTVDTTTTATESISSEITTLEMTTTTATGTIGETCSASTTTTTTTTAIDACATFTLQVAVGDFVGYSVVVGDGDDSSATIFPPTDNSLLSLNSAGQLFKPSVGTIAAVSSAGSSTIAFYTTGTLAANPGLFPLMCIAIAGTLQCTADGDTVFCSSNVFSGNPQFLNLDATGICPAEQVLILNIECT